MGDRRIVYSATIIVGILAVVLAITYSVHIAYNDTAGKYNHIQGIFCTFFLEFNATTPSPTLEGKEGFKKTSVKWLTVMIAT